MRSAPRPNEASTQLQAHVAVTPDAVTGLTGSVPVDVRTGRVVVSQVG